MSYLKVSANRNQLHQEFKWCEGKNENHITYFPCSTVNILIGANNSRKSRFLRYLIHQNHFLITSKFITSLLRELRQAINALQIKNTAYIDVNSSVPGDKHISSLLKPILEYQQSGLVRTKVNQYYLDKLYEDIATIYSTSSTDHEKLDSLYQKIDKSIILLKSLLYYSKIKTKIPPQIYSHATQGEFHYYFKVKFNDVNEQDIYKKLSVLENVLSRFPKDVSYKTPPKTYIPTLRGAISLKSDNTTINPKIYENTIRANYKLPEKTNVFTGLDLYDRIKKSRNSRKEERKNLMPLKTF